MTFNKQSLVTIAMPSYNHEKYIEEAINSTIEQSYENIEFIIIDDGSKDNTKEIIKKLEKKCKERFVNYIYIEQENKGISYTLNKILNMAKGEYFIIISSDDTQTKNRVEENLKFFEENPEYDFCYTGYNDIDDNGNITNVTFPDESFDLDFEELIFRKRYFSYFVYMARTAILKEIGGYISGIKIEDLELALRVAYKNKKAMYLKKVLYSHRLHGENTVKKLLYMKEGMFQIFDIYKNYERYNEVIEFWEDRYKKRNYHEFINKVYEQITKYNHSSLKILIYGYGSFGKIIELLIPNANYCFVDKSSNKLFSYFIKGEIYSKDSLFIIEFDYIFISPLWLDINIRNELLDKYKIDSRKIIIFESSELA